MKIACPVCGQHFDVEANMLDRYFRCTECQTLFLGLNAKAVKETRIIRKKAGEPDLDDVVEELLEEENQAAVEDTVEAAEAVEPVENAEAAAADKAAEAVLAPVGDAAEAKLKALQDTPLNAAVDFLASEQKDSEDALPRFSGDIFVGSGSRTVAVWSVFAVGLAALILAITALVKFGDMAENIRISSELKKEYLLKLEQLEKRFEAVKSEHASLGASVDSLLRFRDHLSNKIGAINVETQLSAIDSKLKTIEERSAELEKFKEKLDKLESKVSGSSRSRR